MSRSPHLLLARIAIETRSPLSIGSGARDAKFDVVLQREANGLPVVPGTALAGVLRSAIVSREPGLDRELFGSPRPTERGRQPQGREQLIKSNLTVSDGYIHDCNNQPVDGLVTEIELLEADPILRLARELQPLRRDHVRLNHRGTANDRAKFDRGALPCGYRFTFEVSIRGPKAKEMLEAIVTDLQSGELRLGGATRRGYGDFVLIDVKYREFDLRSQLADFADWPTSLRTVPPEAERLSLEPNSTRDEIKLTLEPLSGWRIGGGSVSLRTVAGKLPDDIPYVEPEIKWNGDKAEIVASVVVVPASAIKGALRHRTAYHLNLLLGRFAGEIAAEENEPAEMEQIFGSVKDESETAAQRGRAGRLVINDIRVGANSVETWTLDHVGIDRFTGGALEGALFTEQAIWKGQLELRLELREAQRISPHARQALRNAIVDLAESRLPIGAGAGKGHGFVRADWLSAAIGTWLEVTE